MKISSISILGYGKWSNVEFNQLADFQLIYGGNEAGKSTIMAFIHSILFGFPTKQSTIPRMEPKNKGPYGGKITLTETKLGTVTIERLRGKATGDVTVQVENGAIFGEEKLAEILGEMDRHTYEAIFSFDIHGLQQVQQMKQSEFEKQLLATGTSGSDTLLKAIEKLEKQMDQLFKPSGRNPKINQAIQETNKIHESYLVAKQKNDNYAALLAELTELDEASQNRFNEQKKLAGELSTLEWMKDKWPVYSEWQTLQEKTKQDFYFPADGNIRLEHFINRLRERENELLQLQERKKALEEPTFSNDAILNKAEALEIESLLEMWPVYQERKAAFQELRYTERKQLGQVTLHFGDMVPSFNSDMDRQVEQIVQAMAEIDSDFQTEELTLTFLKKEEESVQEEIDSLEQVMLPIKEWGAGPTHSAKSRGWEDFMFPIATFALLFAIIMAIFATSFWTLGLVLLFGCCALFFYMRRQPQTVGNSFVYEEQKRYRDKWQQLYAKMDRIAHKKAHSEELLQEIAEKKANLEAQQALLYEKFSMQPKNDFLRDMAEVKEQIALQKSLAATRNQLAEKEKLIISWEEKLSAITGDVNSKEEHVAILRQNLISYRENQTNFAKREEKLEQLHNQIDLLERDVSGLKIEKDNLMAQAGALSEEDFRQKGLLAKGYEQARERLLLIEAELPNPESFEAYRNLAELKEREFSVKQKMADLEAKGRDSERQRAELKHEIERLEEGGVYANQKQMFYLAQTDLTELAEEWFVLKTAHEVLKKTITHLQEEKFPKALQIASTYFSKLTNQRYKRIYFDGGRIRVENIDQVIFTPEELSQATKEQLYLALRFALIEMIAGEYAFPILIDDGFVNFDKKRLDLMMELLRYQKTNNQVIFFTCHEETSKYFSPDDRLMLY